MPMTSLQERLGRYVQRGGRGVRGWLQPEAAQLISALGSAQTLSGAIGEIGVHHGKLFILLELLRRPGEAAVAIDLFEQQDRNVDHSGLGDRQRLEANLARFGSGAPGVVIHAADSTTVTAANLREWSGGGFRLFSVDGGHTAEITEHDLGVASRALLPDGLLILDDYFNEGWPGVSEGTCRFLSRSPAIQPVGSGFGKTFLAPPGAADRYREQMRTLAAMHCWKVTEQPFFGHVHVTVRRRGRRQLAFIRARSLARRVPVLHSGARWVRRRIHR